MARVQCSYTEAMDLLEAARRRVPRINVDFAPRRLRLPNHTFRSMGSFELIGITIKPRLVVDTFEARTPDGTISWATEFGLSLTYNVDYSIDPQFDRSNFNANTAAALIRLRQELLPQGKHVRGHMDGWRRVLEAERQSCYADLVRVLPSPEKPVGVAERELETFMVRLGQYWVSHVNRALWDESCRWDTRDYPRLGRLIGSRSGIGSPVACRTARRQSVTARPGPPTPIRVRRR